jgi:modification methylase
MIQPGATLYDAAATLKAQVRADGTLALAGEQGSIHKMGALVQGRPACNGWTFWHFRSKGGLQPIDVLREQARRQLGLALL